MRWVKSARGPPSSSDKTTTRHPLPRSSAFQEDLVPSGGRERDSKFGELTDPGPEVKQNVGDRKERKYGLGRGLGQEASCNPILT